MKKLPIKERNAKIPLASFIAEKKTIQTPKAGVTLSRNQHVKIQQIPQNPFGLVGKTDGKNPYMKIGKITLLKSQLLNLGSNIYLKTQINQKTQAYIELLIVKLVTNILKQAILLLMMSKKDLVVVKMSIQIRLLVRLKMVRTSLGNLYFIMSSMEQYQLQLLHLKKQRLRRLQSWTLHLMNGCKTLQMKTQF